MNTGNLKGKKLTLGGEWVIGERIGGGGFGEVYEVAGDSGPAAAKFIPKGPGADRELLFVDLESAVNVVPIIDSGEFDDQWVLVMPRADKSLREHLEEANGALEPADAVLILRDVVEALVSLGGKVVHRDLKPENVLFLDNKWCLVDFGISRYAEASTAPDTQKYAMSPPYAAPERWRHERATAAADIYAVGVMAFEMLSGQRPFPGPSVEEYRQQHLHEDPPDLTVGSKRLRAAVEEAMYKAPGSRPSPADLLTRLEKAVDEPAGSGLNALAEAGRQEVERRAEVARRQSRKRTATEARESLAKAGRSAFNQIACELQSAIEDAAPSVERVSRTDNAWQLTLRSAELTLAGPSMHEVGDWGGWDAPAFDVILTSALDLRIPPDRTRYEGRSHSLWYCDAEVEGEYRWYETAFMISPLIPRRGRQNPFALNPGEESAKAIWTGVAEYQLAWPFTRLVVGGLDDFIDRWAGWFGSAAEGQLVHPPSLPERSGCQGSFRKS